MAKRHPSFAASNSIEAATRTHRLRSLPDRLRQIVLYEIGGMGLISPIFAVAVDISPAKSLGLLAALALIVALWNALYSTAFDWAEAAVTGRSADSRSRRRGYCAGRLQAAQQYHRIAPR